MKFIRVKGKSGVLVLTEKEYNKGLDRENHTLYDTEPISEEDLTIDGKR